MKKYALVHCEADCLSYYDYVVNNEQGLLNLLLEESQNCFEIDEDMSLKEFEDEYCCDFTDYKKLKRCSKNLPKDFKGYSFQLSDMCVDLVLYTDKLSEVEKYLDSKEFEYDKPLTNDNISKVLESYCNANDAR